MSFYATIAGEIDYEEPASFEAAISLLKNDGWLDEEGHLVDEAGDRLTEDRPNVDRVERTVQFPQAAYRNLARVLPNLFVGGSGTIVWASTDGCFEGGTIVNGRETPYSLEEWSSSHDSEPAPDANGDFDEYVAWQEEVQEAFFKTHSA